MLVISLIAQFSSEMLNVLKKQGVPPAQADQFGFASAIGQAVVFAGVWFWGRPPIRRWLWNEIKPGALFEAVRENKRFQGAVQLLAILGVAGAIWLSGKIMAFRP